MAEIIERYMERIGRDWIEYFGSPEDTRDDDPSLYNPFSVACELVRHSMFMAWELIVYIFENDKGSETLGLLSASLLEDFLSEHGGAWIDEIEVKAANDPRFRSLLAGVWRSHISEDVWSRLVRARGEARPFD
jgi:hypothetical protein